MYYTITINGLTWKVEVQLCHERWIIFYEAGDDYRITYWWEDGELSETDVAEIIEANLRID